MNLRTFLRQVLARVVAAREEYDPLVREQILEDLEHDLAGMLHREQREDSWAA